VSVQTKLREAFGTNIAAIAFFGLCLGASVWAIIEGIRLNDKEFLVLGVAGVGTFIWRSFYWFVILPRRKRKRG
jgi:hypothetical protein